MDKWLNPELGQGKYKMSLGHLVVPKNKEVLKGKWEHVSIKHRSWLVRVPTGQKGQLSMKTNNDCNRLEPIK